MTHVLPRLRRCPLALAASLLVCGPVWAAITTTGNVGMGPVNLGLGPGDTVLPGSSVYVGGPGAGNLNVNGASFLQLARLSFGHQGTGVGTGLISGVGTRVDLVGNGTNDQVQRLQVGNWGNALLTVEGGAVVDTRGNQAPCLLAFHYCDTFVGTAAGDNATLNVTGAGTQVRIGQQLFVAQPGLAVQGLDGYTYGTPGGTTRGTVNVTGGALLSTDRATIGPVHWSTNATGFERNLAEVNVNGAGSRWLVTGGQAVLNHATGVVGEGAAGIGTANDSNAWATIRVSDGGVIELNGPSDSISYVNLTSTGTSRSGLAGGRTDMVISGAGSQLLFSSEAGVLQVGRSRGTANLLIADGGSVDGAWYLSVGRDAATGVLTIDGADSWVRLNSRASAVANQPSGLASNAAMDIGRNGTGTVNVLNGGQLLVEATEFRQGGNSLQLGRDVASSGTLNIQGAGSTVRLTGISNTPGGGANETRNPFVSVGRDGNGTLNISAGGKLVLDGGGVSTLANRRSTSFYVGGYSDTAIGGKGVATVTGAGSEIRVTGGDTFIGIGVGAQASGQLSVLAGAAVNGMGMAVGRSGGVGVLKVDNASMSFSGQQTGGNQSGAFFVIGSGGTGIGVATLSNGSQVTLTNMDSAGAGVSIGGSGAFAGGEGSLTLQSGSRLTVVAAAGLAGVNVGREGSGFLRLRGASTLDIGDGLMYVARNSGSDGTVIASEASTITAGWVGVGARKTDTGDTDGGTGTFVLINSTLNADQIVIGTNGFLGGTGTINVPDGQIVVRGIFAPGNSPGRLEINGGFIAEAGSRLILEVESDGKGGFKTDELVFNAGQPLDLSGLKVEFRFLGDTNPEAFRATDTFEVGTFFQVRDGKGNTQALAVDAFNNVSYEASAETYTINNFSFSAVSGASDFTATPVPEPGTTAMLLAGLAGLGWLARRRRAV
jgi:hypothetical protein